MELRDYLHKHRTSATKLAKQICYHPRTIQMINAGVLKPGRKVALLIEYATKGEVTVDDVLSLYKPRISDQSKEKGK